MIPDLAPGDYRISVQHEGFKTASTVVTIRVGVVSNLVLRLELGAIATEVMVQAEAVTVDTTKSTVQGVVTSNMIDNLPLNGRNFLDLAQLAPGVQVVDGGLFRSHQESDDRCFSRSGAPGARPASRSMA